MLRIARWGYAMYVDMIPRIPSRQGWLCSSGESSLACLLEKDSVGKASMYSISTLPVKSKKSIATPGMDLSRTFSENLGNVLVNVANKVLQPLLPFGSPIRLVALPESMHVYP